MNYTIKTAIRTKLIIIAALLLALLLGRLVVDLMTALAAPEVTAAGQGCTQTAVGKWFYYNTYTVTGNQATLYGGWAHGRRTVDVCRPVTAEYYGDSGTYYPMVGTRLWVAGDEVKLSGYTWSGSHEH